VYTVNVDVEVVIDSYRREPVTSLYEYHFPLIELE